MAEKKKTAKKTALQVIDFMKLLDGLPADMPLAKRGRWGTLYPIYELTITEEDGQLVMELKGF